MKCLYKYRVLEDKPNHPIKDGSGEQNEISDAYTVRMNLKKKRGLKNHFKMVSRLANTLRATIPS